VKSKSSRLVPFFPFFLVPFGSRSSLCRSRPTTLLPLEFQACFFLFRLISQKRTVPPPLLDAIVFPFPSSASDKEYVRGLLSFLREEFSVLFSSHLLYPVRQDMPPSIFFSLERSIHLPPKAPNLRATSHPRLVFKILVVRRAGSSRPFFLY